MMVLACLQGSTNCKQGRINSSNSQRNRTSTSSKVSRRGHHPWEGQQAGYTRQAQCMSMGTMVQPDWSQPSVPPTPTSPACYKAYQMRSQPQAALQGRTTFQPLCCLLPMPLLLLLLSSPDLRLSLHQLLLRKRSLPSCCSLVGRHRRRQIRRQLSKHHLQRAQMLQQCLTERLIWLSLP